ncbi:MAG: Panacea domain-containing protein [Planktothrix sp.]|jgi:uncharacterized phage-associated protein|uniref:Panacea domain-containing protein n=1 Tax=Planktothrix sp. TaxID=3088171 RepID=UPI0038D4531B
MEYQFDFNIEKGIESILYILELLENKVQPTIHRVSKVLYFADKEHLEKYGRFIFGDSYYAMKHGPVPSQIYDLLKLVRGDLSPSFQPSQEISEQVLHAFKIVDNHNIKKLREPKKDFLSESDLECLEHSATKYGSLSFAELTELSHDRAWESADENDIINVEDIIKTFDNSEELLEHLQNPHP